MFLTAHSAVGVVIGASTGNPLFAFIGGLASHYLGDIIPHGDEVKFKNITNTQLAHVALIDMGVATGYLLFLFAFHPNLHITFSIALAVIGSILPDFIMGGYRLVKTIPALTYLKKIISPLEQFHNFSHYHIIPVEIPFWLGIIWQLCVLGVVWIII